MKTKKIMNKPWQAQSLQPLSMYQVRKKSWIKYNYRVFSLQFWNTQEKILLPWFYSMIIHYSWEIGPFSFWKILKAEPQIIDLIKNSEYIWKGKELNLSFYSQNNISMSTFCLYMYVHIHGTNEHECMPICNVHILEHAYVDTYVCVWGPERNFCTSYKFLSEF